MPAAMKYKQTILLLLILACSIALTGCNAGNDTTDIKSTGTHSVRDAAEIAATEDAPATTSSTAKTTTPTQAKTTAAESLTIEEEEAKAVDAAKAFVEELDGFKNQKGRGIEVLSAAKSGCTGCWIVDLTFERDVLYYPDKTEFIKVSVNLKNWKMSSYTFG
jgi:predicted small secreted protein